MEKIHISFSQYDIINFERSHIILKGRRIPNYQKNHLYYDKTLIIDINSSQYYLSNYAWWWDNGNERFTQSYSVCPISSLESIWCFPDIKIKTEDM